MSRQEQSGQSVRACQQQQASEHSFYQWRKRLATQLPVKFALVETQAKASKAGLELLLASGDRLSIPADTATLRMVLSILREPR